MQTQPRFFVVSIDTERDHGPGWKPTHPAEFRSIVKAIPEVFQPLCERYGVKPTYLLTTEVIAEPSCQKVLKSLMGRAELGTHLHMETSLLKSFESKPGRRNSYFSGLCEEQDERRALEKITHLFGEAFGSHPLSFRAGRYGATSQTLRILQDLQYRVDSSVTPGIRWANRQGSVDFRNSPRFPYLPDLRGDMGQAAQEGAAILEVPVSIVTDRFSWRWPFLNYPVWLRPSHSSKSSMRRVLDALEESANQQQQPVVANMMFHSMELYPNASPYTSNQREVDRYFDDLGYVFDLIKSRGYQCVGLSEIYDHWIRSQRLKQSA